MKNESIYYDPSSVGGLGGVKRFNAAQKQPNTLFASKSWLRTQPTYSLHKPLRKRFATRRYRTAGLNHVWQMDLMEMIPYAKVNKGYKYILNCIDIFSRFARALPLKSKNGQEVAKALAKWFKHDVHPRNVQTDLGKEFYNQHVSALFKKYKINHYTVNSQFKAAIVERFNRTLREKLNRWFTYNGNKVWYRVLPTLIDTYNRSKHSGIFNHQPIDITSKNEHAIWQMKQQQQQRKHTTKSPIPLLNYVRISRIVNSPFNKNFDQNWSEEVFRVIGIDSNTKPIMYIIEDLHHNVIDGKFYHEELQDIGPKPPIVYRIEKIIRSKGKGKHKQYLVKWYGYDTTHNSWIPASQIQHSNV